MDIKQTQRTARHARYVLRKGTRVIIVGLCEVCKDWIYNRPKHRGTLP